MLSHIVHRAGRAALRVGKAALRRYTPLTLSSSPSPHGSSEAPAAPWRLVTVPMYAQSAQTMLIYEELQLLYWLGSLWFRNEGDVVDAGCFLGGSTLALAAGIKANPRFQASPPGKVIRSYDLFEVEAWTIGIYFPRGTEPRASFRCIYDQNIAPVADLVRIYPGDVTKHAPPDRPIEILFIDLAKHWTVCDFVTRHFFPRLVAGHSIVVQQDYLFDSWNCWLFVTMEHFADYFEIIGDTGVSSVVFLYKKQIPESEFERDLVASMTQSQIRDLTHRAIARFSGPQREMMVRSLEQFQGVMDDVNWPK